MWYLFQVTMREPYVGNFTGFVHVQASDPQLAWEKAKNRTWVRELKFSFGPFLSMGQSFAKEDLISDRFSQDFLSRRNLRGKA